MKTTFLTYYKQILDKVSFDIQLLRKEYQKAKRVLERSEVDQLNEWMKENGLYMKLIKQETRSNNLFRNE